MSEKNRRLLIIPPVVIGVVVVIVLVRNSRKLVVEPVVEHARKLRVIEAPTVSVTPRAIGYGSSQPTKVWQAVAEVGGRIVELDANLKSGAFLAKDQEVLTIDPQEYQLVVTQLAAEIAELEASQAELTARKTNDERSLEIEKASLALAQRDLDRARGLASRDAVAGTELRDEERAFLLQQQKVQSLENSLNLHPSQLASIEASLKVRRAKLEQAKIDLGKTKIVAPFACRIGDINLEVGQFVAPGAVMFESDGTSAAEIEVQTPIHHLRNLIDPNMGRPLGVMPDQDMVRKLLDIDAVVRASGGDFTAQWDARFDRVRERLDPDTRTIPVVVVVDKPYERAIPGKRPPLFRDVFCEVEFRGKPIPGCVVVPRSAIRSGKVYVLNKENRLCTRDVVTRFEQAGFAVVSSGVEPGERVIVSDPTPAIEGMLVNPVIDPDALAALITDANGQTPLP